MTNENLHVTNKYVYVFGLVTVIIFSLAIILSKIPPKRNIAGFIFVLILIPIIVLIAHIQLPGISIKLIGVLSSLSMVYLLLWFIYQFLAIVITVTYPGYAFEFVITSFFFIWGIILFIMHRIAISEAFSIEPKAWINQHQFFLLALGIGQLLYMVGNLFQVSILDPFFILS